MPTLLIGVSADNACHFNSTPAELCHYPGNAYQTFLNDAHAQALTSSGCG